MFKLLIFLTTILAIFANVYADVEGGHPYPPPYCQLSNYCQKEKTWQESGVPVTKFNCYLTNLGHYPVSHANIVLSGQKIKEVWEIQTATAGLSWDLVPWRQSNPIQHGQSHSWGYNVFGYEPLNVNVCGGQYPVPY